MARPSYRCPCNPPYTVRPTVDKIRGRIARDAVQMPVPVSSPIVADVVAAIIGADEQMPAISGIDPEIDDRSANSAVDASGDVSTSAEAAHEKKRRGRCLQRLSRVGL